jgi:hypothetical protein
MKELRKITYVEDEPHIREIVQLALEELGGVIMDEQGVIQLLHPEHLLSEQVRQLLSSEFRVPSSLSHETD